MSNIWRSKDNQTIKYGQLIECNMKNIFLKKSYTKCVGKTSPRPFLKNWNWAYLWINNLRVLYSCFYCMQSWGLSKYIETKLRTTSFYILGFLKNRKRSGTSHPCFIFCIVFKEKYFSFYIIWTDQVSLSGCLYFVRYWTIYELHLFVNQVVTSWILKLTLSF